MTQDILRNLARAKATFQARTLETILTEGKPMTHEHTANEEARHGNRDALEAMTRERDRLREALTTSGDTKAAYMGEFSVPVKISIPSTGEEETRRVDVPWTTIKEIMAAIRARAALEDKQ